MKEKITSPSRKKASMKMMDLRCRDCNGMFSWWLILLRKIGDFRESKRFQIECIMVSDFHDDKNMAYKLARKEGGFYWENG
jgi:hypothetical protein